MAIPAERTDRSSEDHTEPQEESPDVLVVGPAGERTGGIARFIAEHRAQVPGVSVHDVHAQSGSGPIWATLTAVAVLRGLLRAAARTAPDVVHVHTSHRRSFYLSSLYVFLAVAWWRRPVVLHVHGSSFDSFVEDASPLLARYQSLVFRLCSRVIVLSPYWEDVLADRSPAERLLVMPNAVPAAAYEPRFSANPPHVIFVSNLVERKGVRELLTAVDGLTADPDVPQFRVSIAGKGPLAADVAEAADEHAHVEYLGYVTESEKRNLLERGSIYVLPSYAEGLPIALLEAFAGGNAVVTTAVGSIPDVVGDTNGRLVPPGDAVALAAALSELVSDPELTERLARRNRSLAEEQYDWAERANQLTDLYQRVTPNRLSAGDDATVR